MVLAPRYIGETFENKESLRSYCFAYLRDSDEFGFQLEAG